MAELKIDVQDLHKSYGDNEVLKGIDAKFYEGDVVCIIGPSGSGKSTFLRTLNLLEPITSGKVVVDGYELSNPKTNIDKARENIGMVFQHFNLFPHMTVLENVTFAPVELGRMTKEEADKLAMDLLDRVGLSDKADATPDSLSGGQKQRVAIAGILAIEPDIIIFDESTSMLDPQCKASINAQIRKLHEEKNITILSITHDMEEVAQSENVIVLENGEIAMQGTPMDIFKQEDKLAKMQLDIPFALKISKELKKRGIFKENVCRLDEVVEKLCRLN